jgi:hypothetical protein
MEMMNNSTGSHAKVVTAQAPGQMMVIKGGQMQNQQSNRALKGEDSLYKTSKTQTYEKVIFGNNP